MKLSLSWMFSKKDFLASFKAKHAWDEFLWFSKKSKWKGPTKTNLQVLMQAKFNFWQETHIFLLFKAWKQLKTNSALAIINHTKTFKKSSLAKIQSTRKVFGLKQDTCFCFRWFERASLGFERFKGINLGHGFQSYNKRDLL